MGGGRVVADNEGLGKFLEKLGVRGVRVSGGRRRNALTRYLISDSQHQANW